MESINLNDSLAIRNLKKEYLLKKEKILLFLFLGITSNMNKAILS